MRKSQLLVTLASFALLSCRTSSFRSVDVPRTDTAALDPVASTPLTVEPASTQTATTVTEPTPDPITAPPGAQLPPAVIQNAEINSSQGIAEKFRQDGVRGPADILVVIDDSDSMREEQENLSTKLNDLLSAIQDADWQIGVITTTVAVEDNKDACNIKLIRKGQANVESKFKAAVTPGTGGSNLEEGIRQAVNGLRCPKTPWVRPDSTVAVLIVSDEDNCSNGAGCNRQPSRTQDYLIQYVENDIGREVGLNAGFFGIFSPPSDPCPSAANHGVQYEKLVNYGSADGKNFGKICEPSYRATLERMSKQIATLLQKRFVLKHKPVPGTLRVIGVKSNGTALNANDYILKDATLQFKQGHEPALRSEITVHYTPSN